MGVAVPEKPKHPGGRPTKLTPAVQQQVVNAIQAGNYIEVAAAHAGISRPVLYQWMKKGRAAQLRGEVTRCAEFVDAIEKALADGEVRDVALIARAASGIAAQIDAQGNVIAPAIAPQWQASAWRLERRMPDKWGRRQRLDVATPGGEPMRIVVDLGTGKPTD